ELLPGRGASTGLSAAFAAGQALHAAAVWLGGLPGAPAERAVWRAQLRGAVAVRARAAREPAGGDARGTGAGAVAGVLVAVDRRRGVHAEHVFPVHAALPRAAGRAA